MITEEVQQAVAQLDVNSPDAQEFHINSVSSANWLLRQLANNQAEIERVKAQAADIVKSLEADNARLQGLYGSELELWARQELEAQGGRGKTLKLLQGSCAFRTVPQSLRVVDDNAAMECVKGEPVEQDVTRRVLMRDAYLRWAKEERDETGEILPGVEIVEERESFSIRFGKEKES